MGRPVRIDAEGGWHHVMNRGAGRCATFRLQSDGAFFEHMVGESCERFDVEVHAYCLMTNHFHLLLRCPRGGLSAFMQHLSANYTRVFNERHGRDGPLFRGRFHSLVVHDERYVLTAARYIHRNPLDIQPSVDLGDYVWSSHGVYLGRRRRPLWLQTDYILAMFDHDLVAYHGSVEDERPVLAQAGHQLDLLQLAASEQSRGGASASNKIARTIAISLLDRLETSRAIELEHALDFSDSDARKLAIHRARAKVDNDSALSALVERVARRAA